MKGPSTTHDTSVEHATSFGRYQLVERLRGPAIADRYRALDPEGRQVIVHRIHPAIAGDPGFRGAFATHARAAATLEHPGVVRIVDFGEIEGQPFLAVEDVAGQDLSTHLAARRSSDGQLPRREVRRIMSDVAAALGRAHEQGVVHGDVRPANVLVTSAGAAMLSGFAIGRALRAATAAVSVGATSPAYVAPEVASGTEPDPRSDLYSLAVIAYELLAGRPPYVGDPPLAVLLAHGREPLPLPSQLEPHIGPATERVLLRALARNPADRHPDTLAFAKALGEAMSIDGQRGATVFVPVPREVRETTPVPRRVPIVRPALVGGLVALVLVVGVTLVLMSTRPVPTSTSTAASTASPAPASAIAVATAPAPTASAAPSAPPSPTPVGASPIPTGPRLGALLYEARLDGTVELDGVRVFSGGAADAAITFERGAIQLDIRRAPGGAIAFFRMPARASYAGVFTMSVPRVSEVLFSWALRRDGDASYLLRLDARTETLSLLYDDGVRWREALAPQVRVADLRSGRAVPIAFTVAGPDLAVYVDGRLVMQARDARIANAALPPDIFVGEEGGIGAIRVLSARLYAAP